MAWTPGQFVLAFVMVFTGSINTLSTKWADTMTAIDSAGKDSHFNHPFVQACSMFIGEALCLVAFYIIFGILKLRHANVDENELTKGSRSFNPFILLPAAMCDMVGTSVMYIGLNLTYASSFQMFRGSVIVFVAILSIIFLRRRVPLLQWFGIVLVIIGLVVVGLSDFLFPDKSSTSKPVKDIILGDALIIVAQIITASQMVYEEKFLSTRDIPPLLAVGWEGIFGLVVLGILLHPFYFIVLPSTFEGSGPGNRLEDFSDAMTQLGNNNLLIVSLIGTIISIAFFNFAGISVTKQLSATTRMILDSVRTLVIWVISLAIQWQKFQYLQIIGFIILLLGMATYNDLIPYNKILRRERRETLITAENESSVSENT